VLDTRANGNKMTLDTIAPISNSSTTGRTATWSSSGAACPPLPEAYRTDRYKVHGCPSQVWLSTETEPQGVVTLAQ
jgi:hypothetical protein